MPSRNPAAHSFASDPYKANIVYEDELDSGRTATQAPQSDPYGANIVEIDGQLPEAPRQGQERGYLSAVITASRMVSPLADVVDVAKGVESLVRGRIGGYFGTQASVTANKYRKHQAIKDDIMQGRTVRAS